MPFLLHAVAATASSKLKSDLVWFFSSFLFLNPFEDQILFREKLTYKRKRERDWKLLAVVTIAMYQELTDIIKSGKTF